MGGWSTWDSFAGRTVYHKPQWSIAWDGYAESPFKIVNPQGGVLMTFDSAVMGTRNARIAAEHMLEEIKNY